jgi:hypothetical protein
MTPWVWRIVSVASVTTIHSPLGGVEQLSTAAAAAPTSPALPVWVRSTDLLKHLRLSRKTLFDLKREGVLQPGLHWRHDGGSSRAPLAWDLHAVDALMRQRTLDALAVKAASREQG